METFLHSCMVVCPLLFLAGFVDAVAGGGSLISIPAYLFVGLPIHVAAGTDKVVNIVGTSVSAVKYMKSGRVKLEAAVWAAVLALLGGSLGVRLALRFSEQALRWCVLAALPVVAVVLTVKKDFGKESAVPLRRWSHRQSVVLSALIGLVIGIYGGFLGPGTGTFLIMAFTIVLGMDLLTASGCAKISNLASDSASAVTWIISGKVDWPIALAAAVCSMLGNWCGARYALRGGSKRVRGMIFVVLGLLFVKLAYEAIR